MNPNTQPAGNAQPPQQPTAPQGQPTVANPFTGQAMDPRRMNYGNIITIIGVFMTGISVFLPFAIAHIQGMTIAPALIQSRDGWILLIGAIIIGALAILRVELAALIVALVYTLIVFYEVATSVERFGFVNNFPGGVTISYGVGMWLLVIGVIVMLIGTIIALYNKQRRDQAAQQPIGTAYAPAQNAYENNGWQFGVPPRQQPTATDSSDWQFGVPNPQPTTPTQTPTQQAPTAQATPTDTTNSSSDTTAK